MAAKNIKLTRIETDFSPDKESEAFHSIVFATDADTLDEYVMEFTYDAPDDLEAAILASPTVDGGTIVDFLS